MCEPDPLMMYRPPGGSVSRERSFEHEAPYIMSSFEGALPTTRHHYSFWCSSNPGHLDVCQLTVQLVTVDLVGGYCSMINDCFY